MPPRRERKLHAKWFLKLPHKRRHKFFLDFIAKGSEWVELLRASVPLPKRNQLDYSTTSIVPLLRAASPLIRLHPPGSTPEQSVRAPQLATHEQMWVTAEFAPDSAELVKALAFYYGECLIRKYPWLHWKSERVGPVISGFFNDLRYYQPFDNVIRALFIFEFNNRVRDVAEGVRMISTSAEETAAFLTRVLQGLEESGEHTVEPEEEDSEPLVCLARVAWDGADTCRDQLPSLARSGVFWGRFALSSFVEDDCCRAMDQLGCLALDCKAHAALPGPAEESDSIEDLIRRANEPNVEEVLDAKGVLPREFATAAGKLLLGLKNRRPAAILLRDRYLKESAGEARETDFENDLKALIQSGRKAESLKKRRLWTQVIIGLKPVAPEVPDKVTIRLGDVWDKWVLEAGSNEEISKVMTSLNIAVLLEAEIDGVTDGKRGAKPAEYLAAANRLLERIGKRDRKVRPIVRCYSWVVDGAATSDEFVRDLQELAKQAENAEKAGKSKFAVAVGT
jgi:hypothetical protein